MKYVAAYLLTVLGGKEPTKENLEALLGSVGIEWEPRGDALLSAMEGKDLGEVLAAGEKMLVKCRGAYTHTHTHTHTHTELCVYPRPVRRWRWQWQW